MATNNDDNMNGNMYQGKLGKVACKATNDDDNMLATIYD